MSSLWLTDLQFLVKFSVVGEWTRSNLQQFLNATRSSISLSTRVPSCGRWARCAAINNIIYYEPEERSQKVWNGFWIVSVHRLHSSKKFSNTACRTRPNQHLFIKKWWKLVTIINYRIVKNTNVNHIYYISFSQIFKNYILQFKRK